MHYNYKLNEQATINTIKKDIKPIEKQKQLTLINYYTKLKALNIIVKNIP